MAPIMEYLLLLDHPASNTPITPSDEAAMTYMIPMLKSTACNPIPKGMAPKVSTEDIITKNGAA